MTNHAYEFGRAVAQWRRRNLDMWELLTIARNAGMEGSLNERNVMIGAFEEYKRLTEIDAEYTKALEAKLEKGGRKNE